MEGLQEKMEELNAKASKLEAELGEVRAKIVKTKETNIAQFKESDAYNLELNMTVAQFLAKERLKMKQFLWKHYQIEVMSFLDGIADELTFSEANKGQKKKKKEDKRR